MLSGTILAVILSLAYIEREDMARFEFPVLFLLATLGMMMMVSANDLIALYVGLELQTLSLYVAAAFRRDSLRSSEAGLKYFVLGALSSGMLLYGASLVYGFAGTTGFDGIAKVVTAWRRRAAPALLVGLVFITAGLAFKVSAVPFHMWTPDVYEGAPTPVTAFFAVAPKIAAMALFVRVLTGPFGRYRRPVAADHRDPDRRRLDGARRLRRDQPDQHQAPDGLQLDRPCRLCAGRPRRRHRGGRARRADLHGDLPRHDRRHLRRASSRMRVHGRMVEGIDDLAGLGRTRPGLALALAVFMFSMAGIPPLAGFFGKLYVFLAAVQAGLYVLAVIGVLASVVAAYYYLRIVKVMYFDEPADAFDRLPGREIGVVLTATGLFTALFFLAPSPVLNAAAAAAKSLFRGLSTRRARTRWAWTYPLLPPDRARRHGQHQRRGAGSRGRGRARGHADHRAAPGRRARPARPQLDQSRRQPSSLPRADATGRHRRRDRGRFRRRARRRRCARRLCCRPPRCR